MANPAVVVDFVANTKDLQSGFRSATGAAGGFSTKLKGFAKAGIAGAAAAGIAGLGAAIKTGIGEYQEATKVTAQTNAVLKSTGHEANVTSKQVTGLAGALMKKSGVDDEAIQSGENLLLTFTNIRNETGRGNKIFDEATKATLDLSVALGKDMTSSATMVGKALNDPVKGMTALSRVGVSFTQGQKDQVKALVESGKTMEAQKLILKELNKEYGGSAEAAGKTLPGQIEILKQSFNNLTGQIVGATIPVITNLIKWLRDHWPEISAALGAAWGTISPLLSAIGNLAVAVANLIKNNWDTIGPVILGVAGIFQAAVRVIVALIKTITALLRGDWAGAWAGAKDVVSKMAAFIVADVTALASVVRLVITAAWNAVRAVTSAAWGAMRDAVGDAVSGIKSALNGLASWISGFAHGVLSAALNAAANVFDRIADGARDAYASVRNNLNGIVNFIEGIVGSVRSAASSVANAIKGPINAVLGAWNSISLTIPRINIPKLKIGKKTFGGGGFGGQTIAFPNVPLLAKGGIVTSPTLAMIGEAGPEAVIPLNGNGNAPVEVRVFIGDTELTHLIRTEIVDQNTGLARTLLAGKAG